MSAAEAADYIRDAHAAAGRVALLFARYRDVSTMGSVAFKKTFGDSAQEGEELHDISERLLTYLGQLEAALECADIEARAAL